MSTVSTVRVETNLLSAITTIQGMMKFKNQGEVLEEAIKSLYREIGEEELLKKVMQDVYKKER